MERSDPMDLLPPTAYSLSPNVISPWRSLDIRTYNNIIFTNALPDLAWIIEGKVLHSRGQVPMLMAAQSWRDYIKSQTSPIYNPYTLNTQKAISPTNDDVLTQHGCTKLSPGSGELRQVRCEHPAWPPGVDGANSGVEEAVHLTSEQQHNLWD